ncbi:MAG: pyrroline-5-carboxylate reductase [Oscillospiraceae bacterium]
MKIGFIGAGNMATAIIRGAVGSKNFNSSDILAYDIDEKKANFLNEKYKITTKSSVSGLINACDVVVLAVKPNVLKELLELNRDSFMIKSPLIISIAAGKELKFYEEILNYNARLVRVMPNINATVNEAMSAYCFNSNVSDKDKSLVELLCNSFGNSTYLDEKFFPCFGVLAGCSPAFAFMFIDSLATAAVKSGMNKEIALNIAAQTVLGSAKLILESSDHPYKLVDAVCSPGGTTIEGVVALKDEGFDAAIIKAFDASLDKDKRV